MSTIAAIDLGSNSAHLVIADVSDDASLRILDSDKIPLRLAQGLDDEGNLTEDALERTTAAFRQMKDIAGSYTNAIRAVATHATREAKNHDILLERVFKETGIRIEIIDGIEEARLEFLGMQQGLPIRDQKCLLVDIGGGSTEMIVGSRGQLEFDHISSMKLGAVTLTKRYLGRDVQDADIKRMERYISNRIAPLGKTIETLHYDMAIASSGTAKAVASIVADLHRNDSLSDPNGFTFTEQELASTYDELKDLKDPTLIRTRLPLDSKRAEIILAGTAVLTSIGQVFGVEEWTVSSYSLREGLVVSSSQRRESESRTCSQDLRWQSIINFGHKMGVESEFASHVSDLAAKIYDDLSREFPIGSPIPRERELLAAAAYLLEVGKLISYPRYHKHSWYIISQSSLMGFSQYEKQILALIVRFSRKGIATLGKSDYLPALHGNIERVNLLSSCLRIASSLNRSRKQRIIGVRITRASESIIEISPIPREPKLYPETELYKLNQEIPTLCRALDCEIEIVEN